MEKAVALRFEGGIIYRNVRELDTLLAELDSLHIAYAQVDPQKMKYASCNLVLVFRDKETQRRYLAGEIEYKPGWDPSLRQEVQRVNPLKAAKRASKWK